MQPQQKAGVVVFGFECTLTLYNMNKELYENSVENLQNFPLLRINRDVTNNLKSNFNRPNLLAACFGTPERVGLLNDILTILRNKKQLELHVVSDSFLPDVVDALLQVHLLAHFTSVTARTQKESGKLFMWRTTLQPNFNREVFIKNAIAAAQRPDNTSNVFSNKGEFISSSFKTLQKEQMIYVDSDRTYYSDLQNKCLLLNIPSQEDVYSDGGANWVDRSSDSFKALSALNQKTPNNAALILAANSNTKTIERRRASKKVHRESSQCIVL